MHTTTLADPQMLWRLSLLCGEARPFHRHFVFNGEEEWAYARFGDAAFFIPLERRDKVSFGPLTERLLWLLHVKVREKERPDIVISVEELRNSIWGSAVPQNWKQSLRKVLHGIEGLGITNWPPDGQTLSEAEIESRIAYIFNPKLRGKGLKFVIGNLLGSLESCCIKKNGVEEYDFSNKKLLRALRKVQRLIDVYVPCYLGDRAACDRLKPRQKLLLQIILRELTFPSFQGDGPPRERRRRSLQDGERIENAQIRDFHDHGTISCPDLDANTQYVGFNANNARRGLGYLLATWQERGRYKPHERMKFLDDVKVLCDYLGLVAGAIDKSNQWCSLEKLRNLVASPRHRLLVERLHFRIYVREDFLEDWNQLFGWNAAVARYNGHTGPSSLADLNIFDELSILMKREGLRQRQVASELGVTKQYVSKILKQRRCSSEMQKRIEEFIESRGKPAGRSTGKSLTPPQFGLVRTASDSHLEEALRYHGQGWAVVPVKPGTKKPYSRWKEFQTSRPDREQIGAWWECWPKAGIAVVLGPVSDLICVDVDGQEPYQILRDLVGDIPVAPTVKSGSQDLYRFHLYFRHPKGVQSRASVTPWNEQSDPHKLELRGHQGILMLPPSLHPSGENYLWVEGRTLEDLTPPDLPQPLLEGLRRSQKSTVPGSAQNKIEIEILGRRVRVSKSTADFLAGDYADARGSWNNRLFKAACDLRAVGVKFSQAEELLLQGAQPRTMADKENARNSIRSAYAQKREPSRH